MRSRVQWYADSGHLVSDNVPLYAVPPDADWPPGTLTNVLCFGGHPLAINFVGTVHRYDITAACHQQSSLRFEINLLRDCDRDGFGKLMGRYSPGIRERSTLRTPLLTLTIWFLRSYKFPQSSHHPGVVPRQPCTSPSAAPLQCSL